MVDSKLLHSINLKPQFNAMKNLNCNSTAAQRYLVVYVYIPDYFSNFLLSKPRALWQNKAGNDEKQESL
jgi:hypothetical protein